MIENSVEQIVERCEAEFERLRAARPALSSCIERAENILVTHLSCPKVSIIRPQIRGGALVAYLVKGSGGAVYRIDPASWRCSCPDAHRRGKGCKHAILCLALWRAYRPAPAPTHDGRRRQCATEPKITRHEATNGQVVVRDGGAGDFEHVGGVAARVFAGVTEAAFRKADSYEERECSRCFEGLVYDGQAGSWLACERCEGSGRALVFVYQACRATPFGPSAP